MNMVKITLERLKKELEGKKQDIFIEKVTAPAEHGPVTLRLMFGKGPLFGQVVNMDLWVE